MTGSIALAAEIARVLAALPGVERARRRGGPRPLVERLRAGAIAGAGPRQRDAAARARLRRAIAIVDARCPGGENCYRRVLLEMTLDAGAAATPLCIGVNASGGPASGHAWLAGAETPPERYDVVIEI